MAISVSILADSVSPHGVRLTTMSITYPRIIHAEMLRHRVLSRCAASSRAIPVSRFMEQVLNDSYVPREWGANRRGMSAGDNLDSETSVRSMEIWMRASTSAVLSASNLMDNGVHKQITNRLLEPFQWMTEIVSGTEWGNFFHRRIHPEAHPEIQMVSKAMYEAMSSSNPVALVNGEWHRPLVSVEDAEYLSTYDKFADQGKLCDALNMVSVGRVARVSYLRHDDTSSIMLDLARAENMLKNAHMSPFEHVARPLDLHTDDAMVRRSIKFPLPSDAWGGNFRGWWQLRKTIPCEDDMPVDIEG